MDWKMPGMDGLETAQRIKENPLLVEEPPRIILVTTHSRNEVIQDERQTLIDGFITKPVGSSQLLSAIMAVFGKNDSHKRKTRKQDQSRDVEAIKGILGAKVLLADDNEINQQVATELLESNGLQVTVVNNGLEVLEVIGKSAFDIILMDIQMPEMDGLQTTVEIRKYPFFKDLPILAMTAHAMAGDREKSLAVGMDDHITKPIDPDKLFNALLRWIPIKERAAPDRRDQTFEDQTDETLPEQLPGIDMESGLRRVRGNRKLFVKLLKEFRQDFQGVIATIRTNLDLGKKAEVRRLLHTIKGVSGSLAANDLHESVCNFERAVMEGQRGSYGALLERFEAALTPVFQGIATLETMPAKSTNRVDDLAQEPAPPIDVETLKPLFLELALQLEAGLSKSENKLMELMVFLDGSEHSTMLRRIREQIENFDFEDAMESLSELARSLGISLDVLEK